MIGSLLLLLLQTAAPTPQIERGQTLFFAANGCGTCHALNGRGTAVGPDLKILGRIGVRALVIAIRASRTQYVESVKLKGSDPFPGIKVSEDATAVQYYDLSKTPPELRKLAPGDIQSRTDNSTWKHPPADHGYTNQQIADIVAYIRWAAAGDKKVVDPSDVE
jgi:mono/diheme cytochrome c family protein